jgi:hypothetical protein
MRTSKMPDYEFSRNMDQETIANRVRSLKSDELSALVENAIVMIDCGHFPHEAFHEVRAVYKLLLNLKVGVKENETFN